jgi:hypothetical protein
MISTWRTLSSDSFWKCLQICRTASNTHFLQLPANNGKCYHNSYRQQLMVKYNNYWQTNSDSWAKTMMNILTTSKVFAETFVKLWWISAFTCHCQALSKGLEPSFQENTRLHRSNTHLNLKGVSAYWSNWKSIEFQQTELSTDSVHLIWPQITKLAMHSRFNWKLMAKWDWDGSYKKGSLKSVARKATK